MDAHTLTAEQVKAFEHYLWTEERTIGTREKYLRDIRDFVSCLWENYNI